MFVFAVAGEVFFFTQWVLFWTVVNPPKGE